MFPWLFPYRVAKHVGLHLIKENKPLMEAYLKSSNDGGRPKLLPIPPYLIHFIPNIIPARKNKKHFMRFIKLLINDFPFFEKSHLKVLHYQSHELGIFVVIKGEKRE